MKKLANRQILDTSEAQGKRTTRMLYPSFLITQQKKLSSKSTFVVVCFLVIHFHKRLHFHILMKQPTRTHHTKVWKRRSNTIVAYFHTWINYRYSQCRANKESFSHLAVKALAAGAAAMQVRQIALNAAFGAATRAAQAMDSSGVQAAAYSISQQLWLFAAV